MGYYRAFLCLVAAALGSAQQCEFMPITATLAGVSGSTSGTVQSIAPPFEGSCPLADSEAAGVRQYGSALILLQLPSAGHALRVDTCGSSLDTVVSVGVGR